jgi:O-antigen/teichoic acid export membrane protein
VKAVGAYAFVVALSPLVGVAIVVVRKQLGADPGPPAAWSEVTPNLGWLLLGSVFAAGLVNAGPIVVDLLARKKDAKLVTWFGSGVLLARIPLFLFQAVQAALLPRLAELIGKGALDEFRHGFRRLVLVVTGVAALGALGSAVLGPYLLQKVFQAHLSALTVTLLAVGSGVYMIALTFAQAVIALHGHALVAIGWLAGMITFALVTWLSSHDLFLRVELGLVSSSVTSVVVFSAALSYRLRIGVPPDAASLLEAAADMPYEV